MRIHSISPRQSMTQIVRCMRRTLFLFPLLLLTCVHSPLLLTAAAAPVVEPKAFVIAKKAFEDKLYSVSESELHSFLKEYPGSASRSEARWLLVQSLYFQEKYDEALAEFKEPLHASADKSLAAGWLFWKGETLSALQKWSEAREEYERFLSAYGDDSRTWLARLGLSRACFELGDTRRAIGLLDELQAFGPKETVGQQAFLLRARIEITRGEYNNAYELLEELARHKPSGLIGLEAAYWLGEVELKRGFSKKALDAFEKITDESKIGPRRLKTLAWIGCGKAFEQEKEWLKAATAFEKAFFISEEADLTRLAIQHFLEAHQSNANITAGIVRAREWADQKPAAGATLFYAIGRSLFKQDNLDAALAELDRIQRSYPNTPEAADALALTAEILLAKGHTEEAMRVLQQFVEKQPGSSLASAARLKLAQIHLRRGNADAAFSIYNQLPTPDKKELQSIERDWAEGLLLWQQADRAEQFTQLVDQFEKKFPSSPYSSQLMLQKALLFQKAGRSADALSVLQKWQERFTKKEPSQLAQALYLEGLCLLQQADYTHAAEQFTRIGQEFKDFPMAKQAAFYALLCRSRSGEINTDQTIEAYEALLKEPALHTSLEALIRFQIAQIYYQKQDEAKALEAFQKLIQRCPKHELAEMAKYYIGRCMMNMDKPKEAIEQFQKIGPNSPLQTEARLMIIDCYRIMGETKAALQIAEDLLQPAFENNPLWPQAALRRASLLYTSSSQDPELYPKALAAADAILSRASICSAAEINEAGFIKGKTLEKMGREDESLLAYLDIIYQRILPQLNGPPQPEQHWLVQCALEAGQLQEKKGNIREAIAIYRLAERISELNRAAFGQKIADLKSRHFIIE